MPAGERNDVLAVSEQDSGPDFGGLLAQLSVAIGSLGEQLNGEAKKRGKPRIPWTACHPVWFTGQIPLTAGAGTLVQPNLYGPELPYWWDLRTVSVWGFTAGTITVYRNFSTGEQLGQQVTTPGQFTWGAQVLLSPQDSLVFGATGVTGSVNITGLALEVETSWLPEYLM